MLPDKTANPVETLIKAFGSNAEISRILDVNKSTITRWGYSKERNGTGGKIPQKHWQTLLKEAKKRKVKLSLRDLAGI